MIFTLIYFRTKGVNRSCDGNCESQCRIVYPKLILLDLGRLKYSNGANEKNYDLRPHERTNFSEYILVALAEIYMNHTL